MGISSEKKPTGCLGKSVHLDMAEVHVLVQCSPADWQATDEVNRVVTSHPAFVHCRTSCSLFLSISSGCEACHAW